MRASYVSQPRSLGSAVFVLAIAIGLALVQMVRAAHGHSIDWLVWALLLMLICSALVRFPLRPRWAVALRVVFIGSVIAAVAGLVLAVVHDWTL
jgi:hypothetical protein